MRSTEAAYILVFLPFHFQVSKIGVCSFSMVFLWYLLKINHLEFKCLSFTSLTQSSVGSNLCSIH